MRIEPIEYVGYKNPTKYYLTFGGEAPWNNIHIRIPRFLFKIICNIRREK